MKSKPSGGYLKKRGKDSMTRELESLWLLEKDDCVEVPEMLDDGQVKIPNRLKEKGLIELDCKIRGAQEENILWCLVRARKGKT